MRVYHLMKEKWARDALAHRRLKLSLVEEMNDPFELFAVALEGPQERTVFSNARHDLGRELGVLCFSRAWNSPVLWSHYGDRHRGLCLGFEIPESLVREITYLEERIEPTDLQASAERLLTTKFVHWRYEDEVRVIVSLAGLAADSGRHFVPFSANLRLSEIITGPRSRLTPAEVRALLAREESRVSITRSRLAFRSFEVVQG